MDFGSVANAALMKAGLAGFANSGMHNPHLHAQMAALLNDSILPRLPVSLEQQLMAVLRLDPQGFGAVLICWDPETELSSSSNSMEYTGQDFLFSINTGVFRTDVRIDRIVSVRRERQRGHALFPAAYADGAHFAFTRQGGAGILLELPASGAWNNERLLVEAVPQFACEDIGSPMDIPAVAAAYITAALAYELAAIYGDKPQLAESLLREMGACVKKAAQDMDDWTEPRTAASQKINRFPMR
jgi:hypothetical protein